MRPDQRHRGADGWLTRPSNLMGLAGVSFAVAQLAILSVVCLAAAFLLVWWEQRS